MKIQMFFQGFTNDRYFDLVARSSEYRNDYCDNDEVYVYVLKQKFNRCMISKNGNRRRIEKLTMGLRVEN